MEKYYTLKAIQWELFWGMISTENQKWARVSCFCLTDADLGQLCSNLEQTHLQFEVTRSVRGFLNLVLAFLVTTEGRSMGKHSQAFYKESQSIKLFLDLIFLKCLLKELSFSALHENEPGNQILI